MTFEERHPGLKGKTYTESIVGKENTLLRTLNDTGEYVRVSDVCATQLDRQCVEKAFSDVEQGITSWIEIGLQHPDVHQEIKRMLQTLKETNVLLMHVRDAKRDLGL